MHIEIPVPPLQGDLRPYLQQLSGVLQVFVDQTHRELLQQNQQKEETTLGKTKHVSGV